jgi:hypothetical protein
MALKKVHQLRYAKTSSLQRTFSTPLSSAFASLAYGAFFFAITFHTALK